MSAGRAMVVEGAGHKQNGLCAEPDAAVADGSVLRECEIGCRTFCQLQRSGGFGGDGDHGGRCW